MNSRGKLKIKSEKIKVIKFNKKVLGFFTNIAIENLMGMDRF